VSGGQHDFTIIDYNGSLASEDTTAALNRIKSSGGVVMLMLGDGVDKAGLPAGLVLTARPATALVPDPAHPWTSTFKPSDLYFAEDGAERLIMKHGIGGKLPVNAKILLQASNTDWSLFNEAPEVAKCGAIVLYEKLIKPAGAALVELPWGKGKLVISTLDTRIESSTADEMWRTLFTRAGMKLGDAADGGVAAFDRDGVLVSALAVGRFGAPDLETALAKDFIGEATLLPLTGVRSGEITWQPVTSPSRDRFLLKDLNQAGPSVGAVATYFSFWIRSPRALDNLLADGPDAPRFTMQSFVSSNCRLLVNGKPQQPSHTADADYRKLITFDGIPLKKGWNHCLIKVASDSLSDPKPATLAVRISSNRPEYFRQLDSAVERKSGD